MIQRKLVCQFVHYMNVHTGNVKTYPRKSLQDRVDENDSVGFNSLKVKLRDWIEESGIK